MKVRRLCRRSGIYGITLDSTRWIDVDETATVPDIDCSARARDHFLHPAKVHNTVYQTPHEPGASTDLKANAAS